MRHNFDFWESGNPYEQYMGRWSRPIARQFVDWLAVPANGRWLDVGCGTGALSAAILAQAHPAEVRAVDSSDTFIAFARLSMPNAKITFETGNAMQLPVQSGYFEAIVSGLALNFFPEPEAALGEMVRAARPGAFIAAYVWDYAENMQMLRYFWETAVRLNPGAKIVDERERFPLCQPEALAALFKAAGLSRVETCALSTPTVFKDFGEYWLPFTGEQGPAPGYVASLLPAGRRKLQTRLQAALPTQPDGSIVLTAQAWAVRGVRS